METTTVVDRIFYNIDAKHANEYYNGTMLSHMRFEFPSLISMRNSTQVRVGCDHALFPVSFYQVNATNDYLHLHNYLSGVEWNIHIEHGNYTITTFVQQLIDSMPGFTVVLNSINGKLRFSAPYHWRIYADSTCQELIGALEGEDYVGDPGVSVFMPFPANLLGTDKLLIHAENLPCQNRDANGQPFFFSVPVDAPPFNIVTYENNRNDSCLMPPGFAADYIEIYITSEDGNPIDFQNCGWQMTIFVEYHSERQDDWIYSLSDVLRNYETELQEIQQGQPPASHDYNLRTKKRHHKEDNHGKKKKAR